MFWHPKHHLCFSLAEQCSKMRHALKQKVGFLYCLSIFGQYLTISVSMCQYTVPTIRYCVRYRRGARGGRARRGATAAAVGPVVGGGGGSPNRRYKAPRDYTKPQQIMKAPTDYTKPKKTLQRLKILDKSIKY